jgi:cholesterol transport system auxiliary component
VKRSVWAVSVLTLTGCHVLGSGNAAKTAFDFGPPAARELSVVPKTLPDLVVADIAAPGWMDNPAMYYRLVYRNAANPLPYANSQWVMSPAALLTQRLRWTLAAATEEHPSTGASGQRYRLHGELVEFEQIFDEPGHSRGILRLRATLDGPRDARRAQRLFEIERPAATPDAAGGAQALSMCAAELADSVTVWVAETLSSGTADGP